MPGPHPCGEPGSRRPPTGLVVAAGPGSTCPCNPLLAPSYDGFLQRADKVSVNGHHGSQDVLRGGMVALLYKHFFY